MVSEILHWKTIYAKSSIYSKQSAKVKIVRPFPFSISYIALALTFLYAVMNFNLTSKQKTIGSQTVYTFYNLLMVQLA